jgi:hypothetical protein
MIEMKDGEIILFAQNVEQDGQVLGGGETRGMRSAWWEFDFEDENEEEEDEDNDKELDLVEKEKGGLRVLDEDGKFGGGLTAWLHALCEASVKAGKIETPSWIQILDK